MNNYPGSRAAASVDRRASTYGTNGTTLRMQAGSGREEQKTAAAGSAVYGLNASERRTRNPLQHHASVEQHQQQQQQQQRRLTRQPTSVSARLRDEARPLSSRPSGLDSTQEWNPQASLVSASTAPLATRISVPPPSSHAPAALQPRPLVQLTLDEQEAAILDDILYVLMGFEGQYIRFVDTYDPLEERDCLAGPDFRLLPGLDPSLRDLTTSLLRIAKHYIALEAFVEVQSREEFGSVNHALCAAIRRLLKDYLVLVAQLEHQLLTTSEFTLHVLSLHTKQTSHMLLHLYSLAQEVLRKNSMLAEDDDDDDDSDDLSNVDDIIEALREGADPTPGRRVCKGGSVLGLITTRLSSLAGDPAAKTLLTALLRDASRPYMAMLNEWLHHGGIRDPHGEFLIKEQKSIRREGLEQDYTDEYWEKRYTVREADVPPQLEHVKDKVLLAGKYLNVVRECGGVDVSKEVRDVPLSFEDPRFLDNVNGAYAHANSALLRLLLTTHALPARLRSLKHYFFLDRSDFFSYFLELGHSELRKPARQVNTGKLQSLLDIVLRQPGSVAAEDPFKEDVKVQMNEMSLTNWLMRVVNVTGLDQDAANQSMSNILTPAVPPPGAAAGDDKDIKGFDALTLDYLVPFPLSLVISRVTLTRYQLLFRYLLSLRHLETLLAGSWTEHMKGATWRHRSSDARIELWKRKAWTLRARMLVFVQQLLYFCTSEVIEPNWQGLMARVNETEEGGGAGSDSSDGDWSQPRKPRRTVDELMQDHVDFLSTCLRECMLTNSKLLRINSKVITTCTMFAKFTAHLSRYLVIADADLAAKAGAAAAGNGSADVANTSVYSNAANLAYNPKKLDEMFETLQKYEDNFLKHLKILLDALNYLAATETVVFLGLCARLSTAAEGVQGLSVGTYG